MRWLKDHLWVAVGLGAGALLLAVLGPTLTPKPEDLTLDRIEASGALRVGVDASFPPFETLDENGQMVGFDIDLANELGRRMGWRVEFVNIAYDGLLDALAAGRVDALISALADLPQAAGKASFTLPYFNAGDALIVRAGAGIGSIEDMAGRTLAVEIGSGGDVEARIWERRLADLKVTHYPDPDAAAAAVINGEADGALLDGIAARLAVGHHEELAWAGHVNDVLFAIAVPADSATLRDRLSATIQGLLADGTIERLTEKWFGAQEGAAR